jgi:hypothetical protein
MGRIPSLIMIKILLPILFISGLLLFWFTREKKNDTLMTGANTQEITITKTQVDVSEDPSSLGFSGQKKLAVDSKGDIYVAYRKKVDGYYEVFVTKLHKNKTDKYQVIATNQVSHNEGETNQRVPSLAIDGKDTIHIVWYGADSSRSDGDRQIKYARSEDKGNTWSAEINISNIPGYKNQDLWQEHPSLLVGKNNALYVVWEGKDQSTNNQQIKFSKSVDNGNTWSKWIDIKHQEASQSRPTMIERNGKLFVFMYSKLNLPETQIWYTTSQDNGKTWGSWKNISNSKNDARHLHAVIDNQDTIHLVWRELNPQLKKTQIMYSAFDGKDWSESITITTSDSFQYFPQVGIDKNNTVFVTWVETKKKYGFPEESPEEGDSFFSSKTISQNTFSDKSALSKNSYYPTVIPNSIKEGTFILYATEDENFPITFADISF